MIFTFNIQNFSYSELTNFTSNSVYMFIYFFLITPWLILFTRYNGNSVLQSINVSTNFALTNALSFYHPLLLFISIKLFARTIKKLKHTTSYSKQNNYVIFTIALGAWWSSQELLWGGFWNWDFVEVTLMYLTFNAIVYSHNKKSIIKYNMFVKHFFIILILYIIVNRTPIISSQHAFATSLFFKYNKWYAVTFMFFTNFFIFIKKNYISKYIIVYWNSLIFILFFLLLSSSAKQIFNTNYTLPIVIKLFLKYVVTVTFIKTNVWFLLYQPIITLFLIFFYTLIYYKQPFLKKKKLQHNVYFLIILFSILFFLSKHNKIIINKQSANKIFFKKIEFFIQNDSFNYNIFYKNNIKFIVNFKTKVYNSITIFKSYVINFTQPQTYNLNFGKQFIFYYFLSKLIKYLKQKLVTVRVFK